MKNNTYYFSHDNNAHEDDKVIGLVMKCKWEGYGLYWLLNEIMHQDPKIRIDRRTIPKLAFRYNIDITSLEEVITTSIEEGLYHIENEHYVYSQRLRDHAQKVKETSEKYSKAGKKGMKARWGDNDVIASSNKVITSDNKRKEKKRKENKYTQSILNHFNLVCHKNLSLTKERGQIIEKCLDAGRTEEQIKTAITNFSKDDWADRPKHCDLIYAIGIIKGVDKFDAWFNYKQEPQFRKP